MINEHYNVPILLIIFNRPDTTLQVFEEIKKICPRYLYIAADGPRKNYPQDVENCNKARNILELIDWPCEVHTLFRVDNLGCKISVSSAINWFFSNVEEGIILEDDCLPDKSFFPFCQELLEKYRDDKRIMMISGNNFKNGQNRTDSSYSFSRYCHIWGWATWRRAWQCYDLSMELWPLIRDGNWLFDILSNKYAVLYWRNIFEQTYLGKINTWDYQWTFACWLQNGLSILPNANLVQNIGLGEDATHTKVANDCVILLSSPMEFPLIHPKFIIRNNSIDQYVQATIFRDPGLYEKLFQMIIKIKKFFSTP